MRILFDRERCQGHAMCAFAGPDAYPLDDSGYNALPAESGVAPGFENQAANGANQCPERAITIVEAPRG